MVGQIDLQTFLTIPAESFPGMTAEEWDLEIKKHVNRQLITRDFIEGKITPEDFWCYLAEDGYDPIFLDSIWEEAKLF